MSVLSRRESAGVATLTLERPQARNALSMELMTALLGALESVSKDSSIKAVILRGAGPAFCAGHDLKELRANPGRAFMQDTFETCARLMLAITALRQPVIAAVHGIATAAGCQLVATCDLAVCADDARFATPGVNIGLFCSTPMVALTRAVGRKAAMKMLLTGEMIDAAEAVRIGLVNAAVPSSKLHETVEALAAQIAAKSAPVVAIGKQAFARQIDMTLGDAYTYAGSVMTENMMLRDAAEGIDAFLEKRKPTWCGE
jgi:enoyl-CoA hydratase/carnithine racemase